MHTLSLALCDLALACFFSYISIPSSPLLAASAPASWVFVLCLRDLLLDVPSSWNALPRLPAWSFLVFQVFAKISPLLRALLTSPWEVPPSRSPPATSPDLLCRDSLSTVSNSLAFYIFIFCLRHRHWSSCLSCSLLCPQQLKQCLAPSRCSISTGRINEWTNTAREYQASVLRLVFLPIPYCCLPDC